MLHFTFQNMRALAAWIRVNGLVLDFFNSLKINVLENLTDQRLMKVMFNEQHVTVCYSL